MKKKKKFEGLYKIDFSDPSIFVAKNPKPEKEYKRAMVWYDPIDDELILEPHGTTEVLTIDANGERQCIYIGNL